LLGYFALQVIARAAADFPGLHPNTAALFYRKIRYVIVERLVVDTRGNCISTTNCKWPMMKLFSTKRSCAMMLMLPSGSANSCKNLAW